MELLHKLDLGRCWYIVKSHKKTFIITEICAAVIALVIGFSTPRTYQATVKLAPELSSSGLSGSLSAISSMMGMKVGGMADEDAISPELYPDVKSSPDFLLALQGVTVQTLDGSVRTDYKTYLLKHTKAPWWSLLMDKIFGAKKDKAPANKGQGEDKGLIYLSLSDYMLLKGIDNSISCTTDKKTGVITISVIDQDPKVAALMVDSVREHLQDFITDYRTRKARNDVDYFTQRYKEANKEYKEAATRYATFSDNHQDLSLESYKVENDNLENEMQLAYNIKSEYATKLELAKAKVSERTPVYTIVQAPMVPVRHIAPKRSIILLLFLFLGFVMTFFWVQRKSAIRIVTKESIAEPAKTDNV